MELLERPFSEIITGMVGKKYGRLLAKYPVRVPKKKANRTTVRILCLCDCGKEHSAVPSELRTGHIKSCGCYRSDVAKEDTMKMVGNKFGRLQVISIVSAKSIGKKRTDAFANCICDCGSQIYVRCYNLRTGETKSCGCYQQTKFSISLTKHGESKTRLYRVWHGMLTRCLSNGPYHDRYRGRGITVCSEWKSYVNFRDWAIGNGYEDGLSIERVNNDGNYEPNNCKWIPLSDQAKNTGRTVRLTVDGETRSLSEWSRVSGISKNTIHYRVFVKNMDPRLALTTPVIKIKSPIKVRRTRENEVVEYLYSFGINEFYHKCDQDFYKGSCYL